MIAKYSQEWDIPEVPEGVEPSTWGKELYERASRFVKIDFKGDKPVVTVYKKKSIIMNNPRMRNELYRNLKVALLGDIGRTLLEQYQQRFLEEDPAAIQREEWIETYSRMYDDVKEVIRRIVTHQPLWGGIADKDMAEAEDLLIQLLDFQSDPKLEELLKEAKILIDQLQATEPAQQEPLQKRLEEIYKELQAVKQPIAEQFKGLIQLPVPRGVKHEKFYLALDKKRRMEVLNILLNQQYLHTPPAHSGAAGKEVAENLVFHPKDLWKFLNPQGVPTSKDTGVESPNFGQDIDITKYPVEPVYRARLKELLKDRLVRMTKDALMKNAAITSFVDEQGNTIPIAVTDLRKEEVIDLRSGKPEYIPAEKLKERKKKDERPLPRISTIRGLSKHAQTSDVIYIDSFGGVYDSIEALEQANKSEFERALATEMIADIDEQLVQELSVAEVPEEEFEALPLAAEMYTKMVSVANQISEEDERKQLLQVAESLKRSR